MHGLTETGAAELTAAQVSAFHADILGEPRRQTVPDGPYGGFGRAVSADGTLVGVAVGELASDNSQPDERLLFLRGGVHPAWRRRGIGRRLLDGVVADCRALGSAVLLIGTLTEGEVEAGRPFLLRFGFGEIVGSVRYQVDPSTIPEPPRNARHPTRVYRGGDAAIDGRIADLHRRAYRGRATVPQLVETGPDAAYLLVFDGEQLVGHTTAYRVNDICFIDSIVVARSHWASGAADALGGAIHRHALAERVRLVVGYVEATNRASRALVERNGLVAVSAFRRFTRTIGP